MEALSLQSPPPLSPRHPIYRSFLLDPIQDRMCVPAQRRRRRRWFGRKRRRTGPEGCETPIANVVPAAVVKDDIEDDGPEAAPGLAHVLPAPRKDIACGAIPPSALYSSNSKLEIRNSLSKQGKCLSSLSQDGCPKKKVRKKPPTTKQRT